MKSWAIVGIIALLIGICGGYAIRYYTAQVRGVIEAQQTIQSGSMRISAYNYFFNLYAAIQSYDITLNALDENLKMTTSEDEHERILATITGVKSQQGRAIAQYNADAMKNYTIGQFRDWQLPYQIEQK